ncbi:hypothetical protein JE006_22905 [Pseudomonas aeruginosa]|nr:hypothetical protein [Pseudomonas aeruginosa]HEJ1837325.1 hypothetical protein [Pseudomonas aeruginosa]HEK3577578.1 hypothetical protein [Pseudomonas aeruginosa]HEK3590467.1 hypothetical protein [Pseudomonas aeruginosa]
MKLTKIALSIVTLAVISTSSIAANYTVKIPLEVSSIGFDEGTPVGEKTCEAWLPSADDYGTNQTVSQSRNCTQDYEYKNGNVKEKASDEDREVAGTLNPLLTTPITGSWHVKESNIALVQNNGRITSIHKNYFDIPSIYLRPLNATLYSIDLNSMLPNDVKNKISAIRLVTPTINAVFTRAYTNGPIITFNSSETIDFNSIVVNQSFTIEILR